MNLYGGCNSQVYIPDSDGQCGDCGDLEERIEAKQDKLTAGENITISDENVISAVVPDISAYYTKTEINNLLKEYDEVRYDTVTGWGSVPELVSEKGVIYIYTDYTYSQDGQYLPGFKVGDGQAYLIDLPFTDDPLRAHIANTNVHVTLEEKNFWNNKVRVYMSEEVEENLIITTN